MSKLSKLYQTIANLKELGLKINDDLIEEVNKLEEEYKKLYRKESDNSRNDCRDSDDNCHFHSFAFVSLLC